MSADRSFPELDVSELAAMIQARSFVELEAKVCEVIHQQPNSGLAWKALGVSLRMQGKDALHALQRAATLLPDDAEAHSNLGNAYRSLGLRTDAVECYERSLNLRPDDPAVHHNLGNVLLELGQFAAAAASYRRALELKPDFAEAQCNLGNALRGLGRFEEAADTYRRALALRPDFAGAHSNLSDALRDLGRPAEALVSSHRAIEIDPGVAGAHNSLGNALLDLGRLDEAGAAYRRALELNPQLTAAAINMVLVLRQQGRAAEAEASCRRALDTNPDSAPALVLLAEMRADTGQFAQAEELYKRAVAIDPDCAEGWAGPAHLRKLTIDDAPWMARVQRLAERGVPPRQEAHLRFALGKFFDDVKDFSQAFANFRRANELTKRYGVPYDRQHATRTVDDLIHRYDVAWARRTRSDASGPARPVLIVGMPRSGTTLAEQIVASHPAVFGAGELTFWSSASKTIESRRQNDGASDDPARALAADYLRLLASISPDALRVVDKMPANFLSLGLIHEALPNARIIHMRRNPIDTCLSIYFQHFRGIHSYARDLEDLAHYYSEYVRLMQHWGRVLPESTILEVPYEGLVSDQEEWTRKMLQFIGVPWDPRCIDFHATTRSVMSASKWQVRQKMSWSSIERWRNYEQFAGALRRLESLSEADDRRGA